MTTRQIACDESGSEGENVVEAAHSVFVHGSVNLSQDEAAAVMEAVRAAIGSKAQELKTKHLLGDRAVDARRLLLSTDGPLSGRAKVVLVDKNYFVVAKVIDLLVEELAYARGVDLHRTFRARDLARQLHRSGPRALGADGWRDVLASFNSLTRLTQRAGTKTTVSGFFDVVEKARFASWRRDVSRVLNLVSSARPFAEQFQERLIDDPTYVPTLDPLFAALPMTIHAWAAHVGEPLGVLHDRNDALTQERVDEVLRALRHPHPDFRHLAPPVSVDRFDQVDSKDDPRVRVADLVAGLARHVATGALEGAVVADGAAPELLRPFVVKDSIWTHESSWWALSGRRMP